MKKNILNLLSYIPLVENYFSGIATIFMLHRVDDFQDTKLFPNENMKVSPKFLEEFILKLKDRGYQFINLDQLYDILQNGTNIGKNIIFTLDDGYRDNYKLAYPIFKKYNIPFTIYITTSFPQQRAILWWYSLEDLIINRDKIVLSNGLEFNCQEYQDKNRVFLEIRKIILKLEQKNLLQNLNKLFNKYDIDWYKFNSKLCMSWDEIVELSKDDLCTIAGHTKNHFAFNKLSKDKIKEEVIKGNAMIESKIGKKIEHFAYPYGSVNEVQKREYEIVKEFNFKTVTTTRKGNILYNHKNHLASLPRIMLTEDFDIKDIGRVKKRRFVTL